MKKIKLGNRWVGDHEPVYIVAEIANNFDGSKKRAKMLIDLAKECGADAVKFQSFNVDKLLSKRGCELRDPNQGLSLYKKIGASALPLEWHKELFDYAKEKKLQSYSAPYDEDSIDLLVELDAPAIKIGSGEIDWHDRLKYITKKKKPIIMALGTSTPTEVEEALGVIRSAGNNEIILLQCVSAYPSHLMNANIRAMAALREIFDVLVGYSDHVAGNWIVPLGAVALGACMIEKHFTDDHSRAGPGHWYSMNPKEFRNMVQDIRAMEQVLGSFTRNPYSEERVIFHRRCLRAAKDIPQDSKITKNLIDILRPMAENGLKPNFKNAIMGRRTIKKMKKGDAFTLEICGLK